jgi:hypothetical protein
LFYSGGVIYALMRDLAAFVGAIVAVVVGFATWENLRAHRKPLQLFHLGSAATETVYLVGFSLANRTPSDRQVDDAWLDLAPPGSTPHGARRVLKTLTTPLQRIVRHKASDVRALTVRHAVPLGGQNWVRVGGLQVTNPLYVPFKISGFDTEEGTLFFPVFPGDEQLLSQYGAPASRGFLVMLGVKAERAFIAQFVIKDDRGKTRAVPVLVFPAPHPPN